ncbi:hypothetical protein AB6A40_000017 [Gnathostoma spinigerum]|uniref:Metalloendopeptidase n=1 Tax=Gnathostoma spinigerum TaxID=75299 RepID=A0ABD6E1C8_9BILA
MLIKILLNISITSIQTCFALNSLFQYLASYSGQRSFTNSELLSFPDYVPSNRIFLVPEDFIRALSSPVKAPSADELEGAQRTELFEGDILGVDLTLEQSSQDDALSFDELIFRQPLNSAVNVHTYPNKIWPNGRIPYVLEGGLNSEQRTSIAQAFEEYRQKTCIRFVPRRRNDNDYVYIRTNYDSGCSSYVGRAGGNQTLSLEVSKCFRKGIIVHELMHALGFFHEHSRTDRDKYVNIHVENIRPGMLRNFDKYPKRIIDSLDMPYDYDSIMHYHKAAFSRSGQPTILPRDPTVEIGQRLRLSEIDAKKINKLYSCKGDRSLSIATTGKSTIRSRFSNPQITSANTSDVQKSSSISTSFKTTTSSSTMATTTTISSSSTTAKPNTGTLSSRASTVQECKDKNMHCEMWQKLNHCQTSTKYMSFYCRKSCNFCRTESEVSESGTQSRCSDIHHFCQYWANNGQCEKDSKYMRVFCRHSCNSCDTEQKS